MKQKDFFYQFEFVNGISIRVQASSFRHACVKAECFIGKEKMLSVKSIHNIDLSLSINVE